MDNRCQFDGGAEGHYEVWFVTLNDPASGWGFWFRYAIDVPVGRTVPEPSLWAIVFPSEGAPFGVARRSDPDAWRPADAASALVAGVGDAGLYATRLCGSVADAEHAIAWDLAFEPASETFEHVDASARRAFRPKSLICAPNLAVAFSGTVGVDGRRFALEQAPGCQQHLWGSRHAEGWAWAHCNAFEGAEDAVFEAISARTKLGPVTLPPLTLAYLRLDGEEYRFNRPRHLVSARSREGAYEWHFTSGDARARLRGEARASAERFVQVEYGDPDGGRTYCLNSEVGDLALTLERRARRFGAWEPVRRLVSSRTTHFELASRTRRPDVPLLRRT